MGFWVLGIRFLNKGEPYGSPFVFARRDAINCISTIQHPAPNTSLQQFND